jgi:hypothetical protein
LSQDRKTLSELAGQEFLEANNPKKAAISKAKRRSFEDAIENASKK